MTSRDAIRGIAVGVLAAMVAATSADAAMKVAKPTGAPASVVAGESFAVKVTVTNAAAKKAKAGQVTFKLDKTKVGALKVKALKARKKATVSGRLTVPATTAAGTYKLIACYGTKCATGAAVKVTRRAAATAPAPGDRSTRRTRPRRSRGNPGPRQRAAPAAAPPPGDDPKATPTPGPDPGRPQGRRAGARPGRRDLGLRRDQVPLLGRQPDPARRRAGRDQRQAGRGPARHRADP